MTPVATPAAVEGESAPEASAGSEPTAEGVATAGSAKDNMHDAAGDAALLPGLPVAVPIDVEVTEAVPAEEPGSAPPSSAPDSAAAGESHSKPKALQWLERARDATTSGEMLAAVRGTVGRGLGWFDTRAKAAAGAFVLGILFTLTAQALFGDEDDSARTSADTGRQQRSAAKSDDGAGAHGKPSAAATKPPAKTADKTSDEKADEEEEAQSTGEQTPEDNAADEESSEQVADDTATAPKPAAKPPKFKQDAAVRALGAAAGRAGKCGGNGTSGKGKVHVSYANSGKVSGVKIVSGKFDSKTASCVKRAFQGARIPAFSGKGTAMSKGFTVK